METLNSLSRCCGMPVLLLLVSSFSFTSAGGQPVMQWAGLPPPAASSAPQSSSLCSYRNNSLGIKWEVTWSFSSAVVPEGPVVEPTGLWGQPICLLKEVYRLILMTIVEKSEEITSLLRWFVTFFAVFLFGWFFCFCSWLGFFVHLIGVFLTQKAFHVFLQDHTPGDSWHFTPLTLKNHKHASIPLGWRLLDLCPLTSKLVSCALGSVICQTNSA